jgi:hypothetical protein
LPQAGGDYTYKAPKPKKRQPTSRQLGAKKAGTSAAPSVNATGPTTTINAALGPKESGTKTPSSTSTGSPKNTSQQVKQAQKEAHKEKVAQRRENRQERRAEKRDNRQSNVKTPQSAPLGGGGGKGGKGGGGKGSPAPTVLGGKDYTTPGFAGGTGGRTGTRTGTSYTDGMKDMNLVGSGNMIQDMSTGDIYNSSSNNEMTGPSMGGGGTGSALQGREVIGKIGQLEGRSVEEAVYGATQTRKVKRARSM